MDKPSPEDRAHERRVREEFTKQAALFAAAPQIRDAEALRMLRDLIAAGAGDAVLDIACGPGIVVCSFGEIVAHAVGIDLTPAMIDQARGLEQERGLTNVSWSIGDVSSLPFADRTFAAVVCRYAFHHLKEPGAALAEMARVAVRGGRVAVADVVSSDAPHQAEAFNRMERMRDPSHVRALTTGELRRLFAHQGLKLAESFFYRLEFDVDLLVEGSFPEPGGRQELRRIFRDSVAENDLGLDTREAGGKLVCSYPIAVLVGES